MFHGERVQRLIFVLRMQTILTAVLATRKLQNNKKIIVINRRVEKSIFVKFLRLAKIAVPILKLPNKASFSLMRNFDFIFTERDIITD